MSINAHPGRTYRYDVIANDPESDTLTYALENAPVGMNIDELGRIFFQSSVNSQQSSVNYEFDVIVTDSFGGEARQTVNLEVVNDTQPPSVLLQPASNVYVVDTNNSIEYQVDISSQSTVSLRAVATDNLAVDSLQLLVNGTAVAQDSNGIATIPVGIAGSTLNAVAIATDTAGNTTQETLELKFVDLSIATDLTLDLDLSNLPEEGITNPIDIIGTVADNNGNPVSYTLEIQPINGGEWTTVFSGTQAVTNGVLGTFDPTLLPNDTYKLRLSATDATGNTTFTENSIDVTGDLKLGNFQLSFTDIEVPVAGIPISVTRTYDSLYANQQDNFGYGWRLEFRDTNLSTSLRPPNAEEELLGEYPSFQDGTKVYITLPGGKRTSFKFQPKLNPEVEEALRLGAPWPQSALFYIPAFVAEDGSELTLSTDTHSLLRDGDTGEYYSPNGLPYNPAHVFFGNQYTLTTQEGIEYRIDAQSGDLNQVTDTNGNTLTYSDSGILSSTGKEVQFERDAMGRIVAVIDPANNRIEYEYDENGDLIAVIDREGNRTEYFYEEATRPHYLTRIEDPLGRNGIRTEYGEDGRLSRMLDVNGEAVALEYDLDNSVQTVRDIYGNPTTYVYDNRGNVLTEIDPVGLRTVRTYDERNNVLSETLITAESGPEGWTTTYTYDGQNNQLSETDPLGRTTYYTYNSRGQVLTTTDALGNTVTSDYSPTGKLLSTTDVDGNTTQYTNDLQGNIRAISTSENTTTFDYYSDGNVKSLEDSLGNKGTYEYTPNGDLTQEILTIQAPDGTEQKIITEWVYDQEGNLKTQTQGDRQVDYDYDSNGNLISSTSDGQTTIYRYDDKGQLVETLYPDDTPADDSDNPRTITIYDRGGRERATIDQNGNVTHYEYDAVGRLTKTIYPDDTTNQVEQLIAAIAPDKTIATIDWTKGITYPDATPTYVSSNAYTGTEYTQDGRIKAEFDSEGNRTEYQYDALGRQTQIRTDAENWVEYTYDVSGNRRTETFHAEGTSWTNTYDESGRLVSFTDPRNQTTTYEYHPGGQLKTVVDPNKGRTSYEYTEDGQLKSITDALNQTTTYAYDDPEGRLTSITLPDTTKQSTYTYDDANNAVTIKDFNGDEIKYVYDDAGTLIRKELLASGTIITYSSDDTARTETITRGTESTVYTYDEAGRLTARKDPDGPYTPDGNSIEYAYTDNSMTVKTPSREITTVYNDDGTIQSVTTVQGSETETTSYEYENGQLTKTLFPNGTAEVITYDDLGRIDEIKTIEVDAQGNELNTLSSYDYEVDAAGNREQVEDHNGRIVTYQYDELNRVTEEKVTQNPQNPSEVGRTITYTYDAVGNLEYKADTFAGDTDYVYNELNQLISSTFGGETTTYTYDDNGSLKTRTVGNTVTTYHWENDGENRLKGVTVTENGVPVTTIEYEYNDQGIRVGKTVNGDETRYLIDELQPYAQVIEQYDGETDALEVAYTYGEDLIAQVENGETSYYHGDGLGSTRLLTNEAGVAVEAFTYDAYGNLIAGDGTAADYLFAGEQRDIETGLDYLRARYYDPSLGRFLSQDAYSGTLDDPMSLHKYQYAHANPVVNTDPSGYVTFQEVAATAAITGILGGLGFTTAGAIGVGLNGGSTGDVLSLYDQYFAGMVDALSFGYSTKARELVYKDKALKHSGINFNMGRLAGALASAWVGSFAATFKTVSSAPWWAKAALGYDLFGAGIGLTQSTVKVLQGKATWWDIVSLLQILIWSGTTLKLNSRGINYGPNGNSLEITPNTGTEVPRFVDFFHGSSSESIDSIINNGLNSSLARNRSGGGRVNRPGSFFAIEVTEPQAMQLAYEFGLNRVFTPDDVRILVMRVPEITIRDLEINELIIRRPIAGVETTTETIFRPGSFEILNRVVEFPEIIVPPGRGGR